MARIIDARMRARDTDPEASPIQTVLAMGREINSSEAGGVFSLTLWGEMPLDTGSGAPWNHAHWQRWNGRRPTKALDDRHTAADFASAMDSWRADCLWPVTEQSLHPAMIWAAERYDHQAMLELRGRAPLDSTAESLRAYAKDARRTGDYRRAMDYVTTALRDRPPLPISKDLFLLRANILIDMNLPNAAQRSLDEHEDCADSSDDEATRIADEAKRLDALARVCIRLGRPDLARDKLERKLSLSSSGALGQDRPRVQTSLLYLLAWSLLTADGGLQARRARAKELAQWGINFLRPESVANTPEANHDKLYLARALAAYAWASGDYDIARMLAPWRHFARERLGDVDPGPWSYIIHFGHLMAERDPSLVHESDYQRAQDALKEARYDLESAIFATLAEDVMTRDTMYRRFNTRRKALLHDATDEVTTAEAEQRAETEHAVLFATREHITERMVMTGVLPL
ncbi:hypothetical protein [Thioalkalivibrio sp. XN279]|uniref:hypothetical protein n=1 Tax=Thioalkalivibrio sp. XN279 TaxID=2714953 RepID=UPI00140DD2DF|nr:hypothetical protein [Thioalkalivibrio sp. XN279]NHA14612.1 hypothetical protein [Thioalkalivibrio sp. XN279]